MPCYRPLKGWRCKKPNPSGKFSTTWRPQEAWLDFPREMPCGKCDGCRLEHSRGWAIRAVHESSLYQDNCFLTLTYAPEHLPPDGTLVLEHFQGFMKRFRERISPRKIRFFHCGEYGENFGRPHYHACIFNYDFADKDKAESSPSGEPQWSSAFLDDLWENKGRARIGTLTFESAAYVARYITKKLTGAPPEFLYEGKRPEYATMSRRNGLGFDWFEKYWRDVYPSDFVVVRGKKMSPPKFYDILLSRKDPELYQRVLWQRETKGEKNAENNTPERLKVREEVHHRKLQLLRRDFEHEA